MMINEEELRAVIKRLLLQEKFRWKWDGAPDYLGQILGTSGVYASRSGSGKSRSSRDYSNPDDFVVRDIYEDTLSEIKTNKVTPDVMLLMAGFGQQIDRDTLRVSKVREAYKRSLGAIEDRVNKLLILNPGGASVHEVLDNLTDAIAPLGLNLSNANLNNLKTFYEIEQGESAAASKRRSIERAIEFIKRVKRETLLLLPEVLEKIKVDVDATAAQKDSGDNALLGEEDVQEFDNLVARIKSAS